jgi:hypothetical protein
MVVKEEWWTNARNPNPNPNPWGKNGGEDKQKNKFWERITGTWRKPETVSRIKRKRTPLIAAIFSEAIWASKSTRTTTHPRVGEDELEGARDHEVAAKLFAVQLHNRA